MMSSGAPTEAPRTAPDAHTLFAGRYQIRRILKQSNGIETLLAAEPESERLVVIKTASGDFLSTGATARLEHEVEVLRQLRSTCLASVLHIERDNDLLYFVMPFVPGMTLQERLGAKPLSVTETLTVGRCVMS